jgi:hypothetical protein
MILALAALSKVSGLSSTMPQLSEKSTELPWRRIFSVLT